MSLEAVRRLDEQAIEASEYLRKNNNVIEAAEVAAYALGFPENPLDSEEIAQICEDPEQRAILGCLIRLHVDSLKSVANERIFPPGILKPLAEATETINSVYRDENFVTAISDVSQDHRGRDHNFLPEMQRDVAKTAKVASVLFTGEEEASLIEYGERLLEETYKTLLDGHLTKPLIKIELELSRLNRGAEFDREALLEEFNKLIVTDQAGNPHRAATVASWLVVLGQRNNDEEIKEIGWRVFQAIVSKHPEWQFMIPYERKKQVLAQQRKRLVTILKLFTTSPQTRRELRKELIEEK
ncbi:MAG TPA: hypothetical protein VMY36_02045 [Patescibacteria group bacterium]|nr:hypothetical protein [Patescibacteria group bacterium]